MPWCPQYSAKIADRKPPLKVASLYETGSSWTRCPDKRHLQAIFFILKTPYIRCESDFCFQVFTRSITLDFMPEFATPIPRTQSRVEEPAKEARGFHRAGNATIQKKDLLNDAQLTTAKAFYTGKSGDFTPEVIKEIQGKVGTTVNGVMDDATLQAIAKFQSDNGLSVDGQLDTKSLPKLFTHGLATDASQQAFAKDYLGMDWSKLTTPQQRGQAMVDHVNKQLKAAGVPEITINIEDLKGASGRFSFSNWFMRLDETFLKKVSYTEAELDDFANTVIHEARHAEQWYNMAQRLAGQGKTASEIETEMSIPTKIAKAAAADTIQKNTAKDLVVKGMYESVYGAGKAHRKTTLGAGGSYADYKNLPEESDAWRVGDEFNIQVKAERKKSAEEKAKKK
jgi:peptidoglycan hydrolase-like protein with peptidoglycan-binding domain